MNELSSFSSTGSYKHQCKFESICRDQQLRLQIAIAEIDKQKQEIFNLKQQLKKKETSESSIAKIELANVIEHNKILQAKVDFLKKQSNSTSEQQKETEKRISELESDNTKLIEIIDKKKNTIKELKNLLKEKDSDNSSKEIIKTLKNELVRANLRVEDLEKFEVNSKTAAERLKQQDELMNQLKNQISTKEQENALLLNKSMKNKKLKMKVKQMKAYIMEQNQSLQNFQETNSKMESIEKQHEELKRENEDLKEQLNEAIKYKSQVEELTIERDTLIYDVAKVEERAKKAENYEQQNKELKEQVESLHARLQESARREAKLTAEVKLLMSERTELINVRKELAMVHNEVIEREKREIQNDEQTRFYRAENKELRRRVMHLESMLTNNDKDTVKQPKITETTTKITKKIRKHHHH